MPADTPKPNTWLEGLQDYIKFGTSVAVVIYAIVYVMYWTFYTRLGVSPEEVGASYASTLLHSIGYFVALLLIFGLPYALLRGLGSRIISPPVIIGIALVYTLAIFSFGLRTANSQATEVQSGTSIAPYRIGPIPILDVSATPVFVEWTNLATPSATKGNGSSWIFEPCLTCANALRSVQHPGFSLVRVLRLTSSSIWERPEGPLFFTTRRTLNPFEPPLHPSSY